MPLRTSRNERLGSGEHVQPISGRAPPSESRLGVRRGSMKLKLVSVASREVIACLDRDPEYDAPYRYSVYLDCVSGRLVTLYERDEDRALDLGGRSEGENLELHE